MVAPLIKPAVSWLKKLVNEVRSARDSNNTNYDNLSAKLDILLGSGIGPANSMTKLEDSTAGVDLTNVRALLFLSNGTITLTDNNNHTEENIPIIAPLTIICEFTHASDINCTVYIMS